MRNEFKTLLAGVALLSAFPASATADDVATGATVAAAGAMTMEAETRAPGVQGDCIVNPYARRQRFDGWGVSLCWWANMCGKWSDDKIDRIVDWLVSPEGLNYRIFRYNIGGGDDPLNRNCTPHHMGGGKGLRAEMEGFKDSSDGPYIWTRDEAQRKIMLKIREKRPDAIFEAFSNSAPYYMTYSGCCAGNDPASADNLKPEYYEEFARYLVDVCRHYKDEYGIEFRTLDPFNEPMTNYWGRNGGQEGCHFDVSSQIAFIKVLHPILKASGLKTVISAADETSVAQAVQDFQAYRDAGILDLVGQFNTHTYSADRKSRTRISALCQEEGMPLWMSEVGDGGEGIAGNLSLARKLLDDVRYIAPSAWIDWQYIEDFNDQWCTVQAVGGFDAQNPQRVKNYYVRAQFTRDILPGYTFLTVTDQDALAAVGPDDDRLVLVVMNQLTTEVSRDIDLSMFSSVGAPVKAYRTSPTEDTAPVSEYTLTDGILSFDMPAQSVMTFVLPVTVDRAVASVPQAGRRFLILPRNADDLAVTASGGAVSIQYITFSGNQIWTLVGDGDGFTFRNLEGNAITNGTDYALRLTDGTDARTYTPVAVGDFHYRIMGESGSKAFDLEGEKDTSGTRIGLWAYGDATGTHRQWAFVSLPGDDSGIIPMPSDPAMAPVEVSAAKGHVSVRRSSGSPCMIVIYNAGGQPVSRLTMTQEEITVPLQAGYYVVTCRCGGRVFGRPVLVG